MDSQNIWTPSQCCKCKQSPLQQEPLATLQENTLIGSEICSEIDDTKKHIKYGSRYQAAWGLFSEYCDNSTIHGIKYLGEQKRPILERIFWICVFLLSLFIWGDLMMNVWNKWNNNPVIHIFDDKSTPVHQIPFPTVTICSEIKYLPSKFNYINTLRNSKVLRTQKQQLCLDAIVQTCIYDGNEPFDFRNRIDNASDIIEAMKEIGPDFSNICEDCRWRAGKKCLSFFHPVLTEEGICYTLNGLNSSDIYREEVVINNVNMDLMYDNGDRDVNHDYYDDKHNKLEWDLENGYNLNVKEDAFPYRVLQSGNRAGVEMLLLNQELLTEDLWCRRGAEGFKIVLTTPGEIPRVSEQFIQIPIQQSVIISIKPEIITTSEGLRQYAPIRRHCYFQKERYLRYFKLYTQSKCKLECLSNFTLKHCECVKFSMPKTVNTAICGAKKMKCMNEAADLLSRKEFRRSLKTVGEEFNDEDDCNCLPACTSITYNAEVSQANVNRKWSKYMYKKNIGMSKLSIFFKEAEFLTTKRSELFNTTDFLANCGGLLGLLMGISTLSIVELVYFCTVRMITNLKMRRRKRLQRLQNEEYIARVASDTFSK